MKKEKKRETRKSLYCLLIKLNEFYIIYCHIFHVNANDNDIKNVCIIEIFCILSSKYKKNTHVTRHEYIELYHENSCNYITQYIIILITKNQRYINVRGCFELLEF